MKFFSLPPYCQSSQNFMVITSRTFLAFLSSATHSSLTLQSSHSGPSPVTRRPSSVQSRPLSSSSAFSHSSVQPSLYQIQIRQSWTSIGPFPQQIFLYQGRVRDSLGFFIYILGHLDTYLLSQLPTRTLLRRGRFSGERVCIALSYLRGESGALLYRSPAST